MGGRGSGRVFWRIFQINLTPSGRIKTPKKGERERSIKRVKHEKKRKQKIYKFSFNFFISKCNKNNNRVGGRFYFILFYLKKKSSSGGGGGKKKEKKK
jgi:hypothetical protein